MRHSGTTLASDGFPDGLPDGSARRKPERYDRVRGRLADALLAHLPLALAVMDRELRLLYWNAQAAALWGMPPLMAAEHPTLAQVVGAIADLSPGQRDRLIEFCAEHVALGDRVEPESWLRVASGRDHRLALQVRGMGRGTWMLVLNNGRAGPSVERVMCTQGGDAWLDALTGLGNRRQFNQVLRELTEAPPADVSHAMLLLDVNQLDTINDTFGRPAGDALLCLIARRLERELRDSDVLARLGGDEFAVVVPHGAPALASRLLDALARPFLVEGRIIQAGFGIGIADLSDCAGSAESLLRHATQALQSAKAQGANHWSAFAPADPVPQKQKNAKI